MFLTNLHKRASKCSLLYRIGFNLGKDTNSIVQKNTYEEKNKVGLIEIFPITCVSFEQLDRTDDEY